jgi:hypothetical protein
LKAGFLIYYLVRAVKDRVSGSWVMLAGVIIIVLTVLNDIAYDLIGSGGLFLSSYGLFLFTFLQAFLVSRNFTRAFSLSEQFSSEMQLMANSFSRFVPREFLNMLDQGVHIAHPPGRSGRARYVGDVLRYPGDSPACRKR